MEKVKCPYCKNWADWKNNPNRPFCSEECRNRDLGKWANEEYRVPVQEESPEILEELEKRKGEE